jgi:hypothetical protein
MNEREGSTKYGAIHCHVRRQEEKEQEGEEMHKAGGMLLFSSSWDKR